MRKRGLKRNKKITHNILKIFGINAAGIKSKLKSFDDVISRLKPHIWMIEETKLKPHEQLKGGSLDEFQVYYLSRQKSQGGGIALGINKMFESSGDGDISISCGRKYSNKSCSCVWCPRKCNKREKRKMLGLY